MYQTLRSIQTQTDHCPLTGEPNGPKVFFRCVTPDSKVHQLKLSNDNALQVLIAKLPFAGPYEWHGLELDPRLTPMHYNMLPGEEHCVTMYCRGAERYAGQGQAEGVINDKIRALNYKIRVLEDEVETKSRILQQVYAQHGQVEDMKDEVSNLRFENEVLREEKRKLTARIAEMEENMSYHVRAAMLPSPVVLDADREEMITALKDDIAKWQAAVATGKMSAGPGKNTVITNGRMPNAIGGKYHIAGCGDTTAIMGMMTDVLENLRTLPTEIKHVISTPPSKTPSVVHTKTSKPPSTVDVVHPAIAQGPAVPTPAAPPPAPTPSKPTSTAAIPSPQSVYPPRPVRVVFINEGSGEEEHHKFEVVPPVNVRRTIDVIKTVMKISLSKAVVCLQAEGSDPTVVDISRDGKRALSPTDILYIAFLK